MTTQIRFKFKGKPYVLQYTLESVLEMEKRGFNPHDLVDKPLSAALIHLADLFAGAFIANHPATPRAKIDKIYAQFENKFELLDALAGMYSLVLEEIVNQVDKVHNGVKWEKC